MDTESDGHADEYVTVAIAAGIAGIPARTLRYWIETGKLPAVAGKHGKLVRRGDVEQLATLAGRGAGAPGKVTATARLAGNVAADPAIDGSETILSNQNGLPTAATMLQQMVQQIVAPLAEANARQADANERQAAELQAVHQQMHEQAEVMRQQAEALGRERALREAAEQRLAATERGARPRRPWWVRLILGR